MATQDTYVLFKKFKLHDTDYIKFVFSGEATSQSKFVRAIPLLVAVIKEKLPISARVYDPSDHSWTVSQDDFYKLTLSFETVLNAIYSHYQTINATDWQDWSVFTPATPKYVAENAEDFFHQPQAASPAMTKASLQEALSAALALESGIATLVALSDSDLKKAYRRAAMLAHPDRNNGDGSRMSELNMLYQQYVKN
jgi:hypothetical protein